MFDDDDKLIDFDPNKYIDGGSIFDDEWLVADYEADFDDEDDDWTYEDDDYFYSSTEGYDNG